MNVSLLDLRTPHTALLEPLKKHCMVTIGPVATVTTSECRMEREAKPLSLPTLESL